MRSRQWQVRSGILVLFGIVAWLCGQSAWAEDAIEARMRHDITYLASDELEGRGVTTKGINLAADFIASEFRKAGLKPAGADGSYFQRFTMTGTARLEEPNSFRLRGPLGQEIELKLGEHFQPLSLGEAGKVANAPVVFLGYGITAPELNYEEYKGVDVAGKVVIILRKTPRAENPQPPFSVDQHAALIPKLIQANLNKAAAVLLLHDYDTAKNGDRLLEFRYYGNRPSSDTPVVQVTRALVDRMLQSSLGTGLREVEQDIDRELRPRSNLLHGWTVSLEAHVVRPAIAVKNVIGVLEGTGPLAKETVILGAHYDHLGYGEFGSMARNLKQPEIHHGADDNASGTTTVIELARRFGQKGNREGRRLVFMAFSGEESGLLGSEYYCKNPIFSLAETVAMVNVDMVGRLRKDKETQKDKLLIEGSGTAKTFSDILDTLNQKYDFKLQKRPGGGSGLSDHASFYAKQIPVIFFWTDYHSDYHRPGDTADKINVAGMRRIADWTEDLVEYLRTVPDRPEYVKLASGSTGRSPGGVSGPRLGIRPSYSDDKDGVLLDGVTEGGAAAKAGLKEGDRIIEVAGKPVKNLETYMVVLAASYKKGEPVELGIVRAGTKMIVKVTPE